MDNGNQKEAGARICGNCGGTSFDSNDPPSHAVVEWTDEGAVMLPEYDGAEFCMTCGEVADEELGR